MLGLPFVPGALGCWVCRVCSVWRVGLGPPGMGHPQGRPGSAPLAWGLGVPCGARGMGALHNSHHSLRSFTSNRCNESVHEACFAAAHPAALLGASAGPALGAPHAGLGAAGSDAGSLLVVPPEREAGGRPKNRSEWCALCNAPAGRATQAAPAAKRGTCPPGGHGGHPRPGGPSSPAPSHGRLQAVGATCRRQLPPAAGRSCASNTGNAICTVSQRMLRSMSK
jgi:hypothetical protein